MFFINASAKLQVFDSSVGLLTESTTALSANTWTHIAMVRAASSSTNTFYFNGTAGGTFTLSSFATASTTRIGARNDAGAPYTGYIDDFRVSSTARYTSNFTAPTAQFGAVTKLATLPAAATASTNKSFYYFRNISNASVLVGASGSEAINGATGGITILANGTAHLVSDGSGWYTL